MRLAQAARNPTGERQQLLFLGAGLALIGGTGWWLWGPRAPAAALVVLAAVALAGAVAHGHIGRTVFLLFSLVARAIGRLVSWLVVLTMYVVVIAGLGLVLRLFGMNRLERDFARCREKRSMLSDVHPLDPASFGRQS